MKLTRKFRILAVTYAIAGILVLTGVAISNHCRYRDSEIQLTNAYRRAFTSAVNGVNEISTALEKSVYAASPSMISATCTEVYGKAVAAQMSLGELPFSQEELSKTTEFIAKIGDYAFVISKNAAMGNSYTDEQLETLKSLSQGAKTLSGNLTQLLAKLDRGEVTIAQLSHNQSGLSDGISDNVLGSSIQNMESEFPEIPSLIYDGPFSEHLLTMEPLYTKDLPEVSEEEAKSAAAEFLGISPEKLTVTGRREGTVPVFMMETSRDSGTLYVEVTVNGGLILQLTDSRAVVRGTVSQEDAVQTAKNLLDSMGYTNMTESYYMTEGNVCTVNFAYTQEGVICYPDLIKVSVALDNGEVVGFEALGYFMSHTERTIPSVSVSAEEAQSRVSPVLTVLSHELAIIPTSGKYEVLCHEFKCENADGEHIIVYVNCETGNEERILILIETESGTLTT